MSGIEDQGLRPEDVEATPVDDEETTDGVGDVPAGGAGADSGAAETVQVDPEDESSVANVSSQNDIPGVGTRGPDGGMEPNEEE